MDDHKCPRVKFFLQKVKECAPLLDIDAQADLWKYAKQLMDTGMDYVPRTFTPIEYNTFPAFEPDDPRRDMNWRGKYTFGSVWFRGTHLHVHPDYGMVMKSARRPWHTELGEVTKFTPEELTAPLINKSMFLDYSIEFSNKSDFFEYAFFPISFEYFTQDDWIDFEEGQLEEFKSFAGKYKYIFVLTPECTATDHPHPDETILFTNDVYLWDKIRNEMLQVFEIGAKHNVEFRAI
jgi:hypothetical protein